MLENLTIAEDLEVRRLMRERKLRYSDAEGIVQQRREMRRSGQFLLTDRGW